MEYTVNFFYADKTQFDYYLGEVTEVYAISWAERTMKASKSMPNPSSQIVRFQVIRSKH
jgi:hypothetical protein